MSEAGVKPQVPGEAGGTSRTRTYVLVLLVETITVLALWMFGHYFGGQ